MVTRVLVVDDSPMIRKILRHVISKDPDLEVVDTASNPFSARDKIVRLEPDVLTLDLEMPRMDGLNFLRQLMVYHPMPVVVVSSHTQEGSKWAVAALEAGAVGVIGKPEEMTDEIEAQLLESIKAAALAKFVRLVPRPVRIASASSSSPHRERIIAIGASTGGPDALRAVLRELPADAPGIVVVQHMPAYITKTFADRLDADCAIRVKEAEDGDPIEPGCALIAPGGLHLRVLGSPSGPRVQLRDGPLVGRHRPSVDVMMRSVASSVGASAIGLIMTGMGADGAEGLKAMRDAGAMTFAQDEESCVIYGMPKQAVRAGGVCEVVPLERIADRLLHAASRAPTCVRPGHALHATPERP